MTTALHFKPAISNKAKRMLSRASVLASTSEQKYRHGAVIVKGGSVVSFGINRHKNNPAIFGDDVVSLRQSSLHAEVAAIKAAGRADLSGSVIYVARVSRSGDQVMSKPCDLCQKALVEAGIKKVFYTIDSEMDL